MTNANVKAGYGFIPNGVEEKNLYYYHPDHLGSSSYITDKNGEIVQHTEYMAFGEVLVDEHSITNKMPYLFNGKELDYETGLYYYGARYYDPKTSLWLNVDPLVEKTGTPYAYTYNNPIRYIDPTGMKGESTEVRDNGDGTYKVVGGNLNDGDKGIYVVDENGKRTGQKLGESATMYSFYNADKQDDITQQGWKGTINTRSNEGVIWYNDKIRDNEPDIISYMFNAISGGKLDFKRLDENGNPLDEKDPRYDDRNYHHRGMYWNKKSDGMVIYGSARDFGNSAAGYIAGVNNLSWEVASFGFNGLERFYSGGTEAEQSVLAQKIGWREGKPIGEQRAKEIREASPKITIPRYAY